jgi:hypothetical protein
MTTEVTGAHRGSPGSNSLFPSQICMSVILTYICKFRYWLFNCKCLSLFHFHSIHCNSVQHFHHPNVKVSYIFCNYNTHIY